MEVTRAIGHAAETAGSMSWEILWALVLGFYLSAIVEAPVKKESIGRPLGGHRPKNLAVATGLGAASSSCSYAAVALARSLFRKGADFTAAMVFEMASTNLVIELGIIMALLLGWQFTLAEFVGGPMMIILLALAFRVFISQRLIDEARSQAERGVAGRMEGHAGMDMSVGGDGPFLFLAGHPLAAKIWGPLIGPALSLGAFVCSIGNVPLAAVLWNGGISFGGVVAFIFADLIIIPILVIYRKYYGTRMALRLFAIFYATMAAAGYIIELVFQPLGLVPSTRNAKVLTPHIS
jgi:uncharacterized protein